MSKMTPLQEAQYAIAYQSSRESLSPAAQVEYDKIKEGTPPPAPAPEQSLAEQEAQSRTVIWDAKKAWADGRKVFLCRVPMMWDRAIQLGTGGLPGPSSVIESLEEMGWRLDQMSWVQRAGTNPVGIFLFRRQDG